MGFVNAVRSVSIKAAQRSAVFAASLTICSAISSRGGDLSASVCAVALDSDSEQAMEGTHGLRGIDRLDDFLAERDRIAFTASHTRQVINSFSGHAEP